MQAAAAAGETYVGHATQELTPEAFEYEPLAPVNVRGRSDPVAAWRLTGGAQQAPHSAAERRPLVGRDRELAAGGAALDQGGVLVISGEAGIGKSRLVLALEEQARDRGFRWLTSRCPAHGSSQPYSAYIALAQTLPATPESPLRLLRSEQPPELPADPELLRAALHRSVLDALRAQVAAGPAVLALEDVHWIDPSSAALTAAIAGLATRLPLLLLLTTREDGPTLDSAVGAVPPLSRRELHLTPLSADDVAELVNGELRAPAHPDLLALLAERTGGNALFAVEIIREMAERGELDISGELVRLRPEVRVEDVPGSVQGILAARLDLLSTAAAAVLKVCAVIGRHIPDDVLGHLLVAQPSSPPTDWSAARRELQTRGLLTPDGDGVAFTHALVQDVAYARLLQRQRRELHRRVADALEALRGDTDETIDLLARHLTLGGASARAIDALRRAADRAIRLFANDEAHRLLRRACKLAEEMDGRPAGDADPPASAGLRLALAGLADLLGDYDEAEQLYREVRARTGELEAWRGEAAVLRKLGRCDEVLALLDEANVTLRPQPAAQGLLDLERGRALVAAGRFGEAADVLAAALPKLPASSGDAAHCLIQLARAQLGPGDVDDARRSAEAARDLFESLGDVRGQATALRVLGNIYQELHREDDAAAALTAGLAAAGRLGDVEERGTCLVNLGLLELSRGRLDDAARWNRAAIVEFERVGHRRGAAIAHANLADTPGRRGDLDGALRHCSLATEAAHSVQDDLTIADVQATRAAILLAQGNPREAAQQADEAAQCFRAVSDLTAAGEALELASRCWEGAGDPERAAQARAQVAALSAETASLSRSAPG